MIYNRVKETSTTSGTGSLTLAGAATNFTTVASKAAINTRFTYWIIDNTANVWETGRGYLSGATTLVRETVQDNSSGTTSALTLAGNSVDVFISPSEEGIEIPAFPYSVKQIVSSKIVNTTTTVVHVADRIQYYPFMLDRAVTINGLGCYVQTGSGSAANHILLGLYFGTSVMYPGPLIAEVDLDPSATSYNEGSITQIKLMPGVYWVGMWSDVTPTTRGFTTATCGDNYIGYEANFSPKLGFRGTASSLTAMPNPATAALSTAINGTTTCIYLLGA